MVGQRWAAAALAVAVTMTMTMTMTMVMVMVMVMGLGLGMAVFVDRHGVRGTISLLAARMHSNGVASVMIRLAAGAVPASTVAEKRVCHIRIDNRYANPPC